MKNYKLHSEDAESFTVNHPDGSNFKVAKKGLGKSTIDKIKGIGFQKMAEGGITQAPEEPAATPAPAPGMDINNLNLPPVDPKQKWIQDRVDFYQKQDNPNLYGQVSGGFNGPEEAQRKAQQDAVDYFGKEKEIAKNKTDFAAFEAQQRIGQDMAYNDKAKELGLPLRPLPQTQLTSALGTVGGAGQAGGTPGAGATAGSGVSQELPGLAKSKVDSSPPGAGMMGQMFGQAMRGIGEEEKAATSLAGQQQKLYNNYVGAEQQRQVTYESNMKGLLDEQKSLQTEYANGKIDPRSYWNNLSTGSKIGTAVGLILGGIGAGMTHGPNAALEMVKKNIDQDIEAQKQNLEKKGNLLNVNFKKYGNMQAAETATRLQHLGILNAQLQQAAAQSGSMQAKAHADMARFEVQKAMMPMMQQMAMYQTTSQLYGTGGGQAGIPQDQTPTFLLQNPEMAKKMVPVGGRYYSANSEEEGSQLRNAEAMVSPVFDTLRKIDDLGPSAIIPGTKSNLAAHAYRSDLAEKLAMLKGASIGNKRISPEMVKGAEEQIKDPTKFNQLLNGGIKNQILFKDLEDDIENQRRTKLIGYKGVSKYKSFKKAGE